MRENSLHAGLKDLYAGAGGRLEASVDGYIVDVLQKERLVEVQTGNFTALRRKLSALLPDHRVRVVYPIPREKWIVRVDRDGNQVARRKSPRKGRVEDLFYELIRIPGPASHDHFSLEVLLTREEEVWRDDGRGSWRRKGWSVFDRRLLDIVERFRFESPAAFLDLVPGSLQEPFTNRELAEALDCRGSLAGKMTYTLCRLHQLEQVGTRGRAYLFARKRAP